jgi:16S rRNA (guanine966-N2)-methyltransferase
MNIRIISGKFGGRSIKAPDGRTTHPMSERVRSSLFNIINSEIQDAEVLDAFAGTGSLGLEALSRGAKNVTFVERDRKAFRILKENISNLGADDNSTTKQIGLSTWTDVNKDKKFDIIFADPPYDNMQLSTVRGLTSLLKSNGLMILSYPGRSELPLLVNEVVVVDNRSYGDAALAFYRKNSD